LDAIEILGTAVAPMVRNGLGVTPVRAAHDSNSAD
jgi:hypothetical protein